MPLTPQPSERAVAHRDYSMAGAKVRLRLFEDRLELYSPGMLPNTMTPESPPFRQAARNAVLTSLLARCPIADERLAVHRRQIMDKRGEGVVIIIDRTELRRSFAIGLKDFEARGRSVHV